MEAPVLPHEQERLAALRGYGVLDTPPEPEFDSLTRLASQICGTPMALLTLVDGERQWFKSRVGIDIAETPRELSFCAHAIERPGLFVVTDTLEDERFSTNPLVLSIPYVRFYAGAPLVTPEGHGLGTLCVVDRVPRNLSSEQLEALRTLARQAMGQLELRRQLRRLQEMVALQDRAEAARAAYAARTARQNAALVQLARLDEADLDGLLREVTRSGSHTLDVERVGVWLFRDGGEVMECAALYRRAEDDHESGVRIPSGAYPAYFAALAESRALAAEDARTDPRTRELAATYLEPLGIGAMLDVPVWRDGTLAGVVCHEHVGPPRAWADDERRFAADLADVVTIALQAHDRRRAEEDLLRARVRAAAVMRAALDCVVVMGADGRVLDFNPAAEATFGYTAAEAMGRDARDLIVPERLRDAAGRYLAEAGGQVLGRRLETTGMRKDGTELPLEMTLTRVPLDGPPIFTAHLRDITERVEGAAALDRSVSLLRATLESTADGLLAVDHAGAVLASNAKFAEMWGLSPNTVKAGDGAALAGACEKVVDAEAFMARICELYGCPEAESFDEIRLRDGRVLERYSQPQRVNGETVGRVWSFRDVTERRHAEADARSTAERMRAVASAAAAVVGAASRAELRQVLEEACRRVLSFDAFFIFGYDAGAHTFTGFGGHDAGVYSPPDVSSAAAGTPGERVVRERRSLLTLSSADPAGKGAEPAGTGRRAESAIRTPIVAGDEVLGIVSVQSYTPGLYGPRDVEVVEALASLAATALRNLRLTEERSAAQDALRRSESRFRALFEQFPFSIQIFSPQGRTLEVNRAWERMFGMGVDDVRGFNPLDDPQLREIAPLVRRGFEGRGGDLPPTLFDAGLAVRTRARPASNGSAGSPASTAEPRPSRSDDTTASAEAIGASESADAALSPESTEVAAESTEVTASPDSTEPIASTESPGSAESASSVGWAASTEAAASSESVASTEWTRTEDAGASAESAGVGDAGASMEATPSAESIGEAGCVDVVASTDAGPTAERAVMAAVVSEIAETSGEEAAASARSPAVDGETEDADAPAERADGRRAAERRAVGPRWIKASICPVKDEAGAIAEVILVHQDVTVERDAERALREARDELERRVEERTAELAETNMAMEEEIAERARAEEELVQKSAELEAVFHALPDLYIRMEPDGTIRDCQAGNDAARYATPAEYVGRRITEVLPPGPAAQMADALRRTVECGSLVQAEYALPADDGAREFEARLLPLEAGGQVVAVVREITERKGWERELKRREEHFRTLIENGTDLIAIIDRAGVTRYLSPSATRLLGWDTAERVGRSSVEMVHPDDREKVASLRDYALAHPGESFEVEYRYRHGDGSWRVFEAAARTLLPESGDEGLVVNARDVTARKETEAALRRSEQHFRAVIENASDLVTILAPDASFDYQSPAVERLFGYTQDEMVGRSAFEFIHPEDAAMVVDRLREVAENPGQARSASFRFLHRDGSWRVVEAVGCTLSPTGPGEGVLVNTRDITERRRGEEALEQAREEAERAREAAEAANHAKSEFLSRMSHELRTPMNSILGFAQLMERREPTPEQRRSLDQILRAGRHLLNLINEVLDIARIEADRAALSVEPVRVDTALAEAVNLIRPLAAQHDCELADPEPAPGLWVHADRQRLAQLLLNLLSNAVKYNRPGGTVRVTWAPGENGRLRIGVHDTGRGIPRERMAELFVPFARLGAEATEVEGTGLGLALSARLAEAMGGTLEAESMLGEGSSFWVELPAAADPVERIAASSPVPRASAAPGEARPATVLYVEDNLANLSLVESLLSSRPEITLLSAMQGRMGLDLAWEHAPELILLDLHLPDLPGAEVLRRLRADPRTARTPVVVISADATPGQVERLRAAGAQGYMTKPLDLDRFMETVDRSLAETGGAA